MFEFKLEKQVSVHFSIKVEFTAKVGEITSLIGKSGAGKSTILNLIAGLSPLDQGWVRSTEKEYTQLPVHLRQFGFVQQQSHLFPHLSVLENLTYKGSEFQLAEYLELFELKPHLSKQVQQLSGGEAQRVSLVRTLLSQPKLLLLDEAFNALDQKLRIKIRAILKKLKLPIIFVTHDLQEAYEISDQVLVIDQGKVVEKGTNVAIFHHCRHKLTATLIGIENIYAAHVNNGELWVEQLKCLEVIPGIDCQWVAIKANQISLAEEGHMARILKTIQRLHDVRLELDVAGLSRPLIVVLSWREYEPWKNKSQVYFKLDEVIYLEGPR